MSTNQPPQYEIHNEKVEHLLHNVGTVLGERMPEGYGFMLTIFEFDGPAFFYICSAEREGFIKALKQLQERLERGA